MTADSGTKRDWAKVLFVDHPQVFLPWMKSMIGQAKADVRGLRTVFEKFQVRRGARILDLACGIGRISINLAKAGYEVVGVDISRLYLDFARKWAERDRVRGQTRFYVMDTRRVSQQLKRKGEKKFDVILNYGTAIGYRGEDEDAEMLAGLLDIAEPHALLVIETVNRDYLVRHFEKESVSTLEGIEWREFRRLDLENSFMENSWRFYRRKAGSRRLILSIPVSHRVFSLHELRRFIANAGWKYTGSYGTQGILSPVTSDSFHMTVLGRNWGRDQPLNDFLVRPIQATDRDWVESFIKSHWGSGIVVARGRVIRPGELDGFAVFKGKRPVGLLTFRTDGSECEIVTIDSILERKGIGTSLIDAVRKKAKAKGCKRLWLITTNDNLSALGFYQKKGFRLVAVYPDAIEPSRKLKPQIAMKAANGIPIRDELELELDLTE